jgi:hypothetical protein
VLVARGVVEDCGGHAAEEHAPGPDQADRADHRRSASCSPAASRRTSPGSPSSLWSTIPSKVPAKVAHHLPCSLLVVKTT